MATTALIIFALTFVGVALTRLPWVKVDRPAAAFIGGVAMVLFGTLTPSEAIAAVDWNTIALLLGMMVIIAGLQLDGYTQGLAQMTLGWAKSPRQLLLAVVASTGVASAFLVNDAVVLAFTPILVGHCRAQRLNPIPFLLAEAMASNIGGVATITGNPQNTLVGLQSGMGYLEFMLRLLPVAVASSAVLWAAAAWLYRRDLRSAAPAPAQAVEVDRARLRLRPSILVLAGVLLAFLTSRWTGLEVPLAALVGAGIILFFTRDTPRAIFAQVDWVLLLFFVGLFVVIGGAVHAGLLDWAIESAPLGRDLAGLALLHGLSLGLSQLVSNVPYTILMVPLLQAQGSDLLWLALASSATLAGNLTLLGAMANLIVAERAKEVGVTVSLWEFFKLGLPVTLLTLAVSLATLWIEAQLGWLS